MRRTYPISNEEKGYVMTDTPSPQKIKTASTICRAAWPGDFVPEE
jgi:hypothetical protein